MPSSRLLMSQTGMCGVMPLPITQWRNLPVPYAVSAAGRSGLRPNRSSARLTMLFVAATSSYGPAWRGFSRLAAGSLRQARPEETAGDDCEHFGAKNSMPLIALLAGAFVEHQADVDILTDEALLDAMP